jgi:hypothetical protein
MSNPVSNATSAADNSKHTVDDVNAHDHGESKLMLDRFFQAGSFDGPANERLHSQAYGQGGSDRAAYQQKRQELLAEIDQRVPNTPTRNDDGIGKNCTFDCRRHHEDENIRQFLEDADQAMDSPSNTHNNKS